MYNIVEGDDIMNIPYAFKKCTKCGKWLVANNFNFRKKKKGKWGLYSQCKECESKYKKQWDENNKEYYKEYHKEYYKNNKEYIKECNKQWRENNKEYKKQWDENNKEYIKQYNKQWRENNKEYNKEWKENNKKHIKEYNKQWYEDNKEYRKEYNKQWYEDNKEYHKEYYKKWNENNPEKSFNIRNKRRSKEENQGRGINELQWNECYKWFNWKCAYSGEKLQKNKSTYGRTLDHIVALDNGGENEPWNIVPMRKGYNSSKQDRIDSMTWYLEQEYFDIERLNKIIEWQIYAYEKWGGEEFGELILITDLFKEE